LKLDTGQATNIATDGGIDKELAFSFRRRSGWGTKKPRH